MPHLCSVDVKTAAVRILEVIARGKGIAKNDLARHSYNMVNNKFVRVVGVTPLASPICDKLCLDFFFGIVITSSQASKIQTMSCKYEDHRYTLFFQTPHNTHNAKPSRATICAWPQNLQKNPKYQKNPQKVLKIKEEKKTEKKPKQSQNNQKNPKNRNQGKEINHQKIPKYPITNLNNPPKKTRIRNPKEIQKIKTTRPGFLECPDAMQIEQNILFLIICTLSTQSTSSNEMKNVNCLKVAGS